MDTNVMETHRFRNFAAWAAIISMPIALASTFLNVYWTNFNLQAFTSPDLLLQEMNEGGWLKITFLLDLFGYYLPLAPLALYLPRLISDQDSAFVSMYTFLGLAYIICGAIGASLCITILPGLADNYLNATGHEQVIYFTVFSAFFNGIFFGLWDLLDPILAGIWWLGIGYHLQTKWLLLGRVSMVLGAFTLLTSLGYILGQPNIEAMGLNVYLGLAPVWAAWVGIKLLKS